MYYPLVHVITRALFPMGVRLIGSGHAWMHVFIHDIEQNTSLLLLSVERVTSVKSAVPYI